MSAARTFDLVPTDCRERMFSGVRTDVLGTDWSSEIHSTLATGFVVIGFVAALLLAWSFLAPMTAAVVVTGRVVVDGYGQPVQYPLHGVVAEIFVRDGDTVEANQPLLRLDESVAQTHWQEKLSAFVMVALEKAALEAALDGESDFVIPNEVLKFTTDAAIQQVIASYLDFLSMRTETHLRDIEVAEQKVAELRARLSGFSARRESKSRQLSLITDEIESLRKIYEAGYVTLSRFRGLQREQASLAGDVEATEAQILETNQAIRTGLEELERLRLSWRRDLVEQLKEANGRYAALRDALEEAQVGLHRTVVRAPVAGTILELRVNSVGQVIAGGDILMKVVPTGEDLILEGPLRPSDVRNIAPGMPVRVDPIGIPAYERKVVRGRVERLSPDVVATGLYAGSFVVRVKASTVTSDVDLRPGIPVRMYIETEERSFISYLLSPIIELIDLSLRER